MNTQQRIAFTLVELLTVITIIGILASLSVVALTGSMQTAKEIKTYGTIQKLDAAIMPIFESYQQRFDAILEEAENYTAGTYGSAEETRLKLHLIHDLMRMEMPSYWREVANNITTSGVIPDADFVSPVNYKTSTGTTTTIHVKSPPVFNYYFKTAQRARLQNAGYSLDNGAAELLFLIVANLNPEALEGFGANEIADTDGNGIMEFVDAWGRPIYFLRTAPGFTDTDRQPDIVRMAGLSLGAGETVNADQWSPTPSAVTDWETSSLTQAYLNAMRAMPDPFDPNDSYGRTWFLYPVIVSAGPDGIFDLALGRRSGGVLISPTLPEHVDPFSFATGIPEDMASGGSVNNVLNHYDNIHNHRHPGGF